jgi:hypothetical protein
MKQFLLKRISPLVVGVCALFAMLLFSACAGVATTTNANGTTTSTIRGSVVSVNQSAHSVTLNVGGQQFTVSGLTDQQIAALQSQVGKTYAIQATQTGSNAYAIAANTDPVEEDNATPGVSTTEPANGTSANEPGSISFIGKLQSMSSSSAVVTMPNGDSLTVVLTAQTDRSDLVGQPAQGQSIKVDATASSTDGSFMATKLGTVQGDDLTDTTKLNTVDFSGVTTSAVGADNVIHFAVGNKSYSFTLSPTTEVKNFASVQAIGANQAVKVEVLFNNGSNGTVVKVENAND